MVMGKNVVKVSDLEQRVFFFTVVWGRRQGC